MYVAVVMYVAIVTFKSAHIDGLVQVCSNFGALTMELLLACAKPSIYLYDILSSQKKAGRETYRWVSARKM